jgi:hypothetical protein
MNSWLVEGERAMALTHKDKVSSISIAKPWASVDSGFIGVSAGGETPFWSTGFSGCIGVVMCGGPQSKWGALAHLNQSIQDASKDMKLALTLVADFVRSKVNDEIVDVLLYYGDPWKNLGQSQIKKEADWLIAAKVKAVMKAKGKIIDLRRTEPREQPEAINDVPDPWGTDFVYDPGVQVVYTSPGHSMKAVAGLKDGKVLHPNFEAFPLFGSQKTKLQPGIKDNRCFVVR